MKPLIAAMFALAGCAALAYAHNPGLSTARVRVRADAVEVHLYFSRDEIAGMLGVRSLDELAPARRGSELAQLAARAWELRNDDGTPARATAADAKAVESEADVEFLLTIPRAPSRRLTLVSTLLADLPPGHRQLALVLDESGKKFAQKLLGAPDASIEIAGGA